MEKNYNGVTITKSWSFEAFAKEFGTPKFADNCVNRETGEQFNAIAFDKADGSNNPITFCHYGYSTQGLSKAELRKKKGSLKIGLNTSGNYTLYLQEGGWEEF